MLFKKFSILFISMLFIFGCEGEANVVNFNDLFSYIEVSLEKKDHLVFRAEYVNSAAVITNYKFYKDQGSSNKFYLFFTEEFGNKKPVPSIEYQISWPGIKAIVPIDSFNPKTDEIFYKDRSGEHKIKVGTKGTWAEYLIQKGLKNIDINKI